MEYVSSAYHRRDNRKGDGIMITWIWIEGEKAQSKAVARMKLLENLFGKDNLKVEKK